MGTMEDSFRELARSMDAMIDGVLGGDYFRSSARDTWDPPLNVYETPDKFVICVELAGVQPGDVDVQVDGSILHIRGHRPKPTVPNVAGEISVHLMEIDSGRFHRKVAVPLDLDVEACTATYKNGYVWIVMPRKTSKEHA
jgi:HSP20 family protein